MKTIKINLLIILFSIFALSCNNKRDKTSASQNKVDDKNIELDEKSTFNSPCDLVSIEEVKNMFAITDYPIDMKDVVYTYPTCVFKWEDGKFIVSRSFGGQELKSIMPSEVLIVMVKVANEDMFNRSTKVYKQAQKIIDLGNIAVWDSRMSQLTFLLNNYMFHVHVKVSNDDIENKKKAIEVSKLIIRKI